MITESDLSGEPGAATYALEFDGQRWEIDLTESEAEPILAIFQQGRQSDDAPKGGRSMKAYERHVRGLPPADKET